MEVRLNGEPRQIADPMTLADLLEEMGVGNRRVAIELNRAIVPRARYASTHLHTGDVVEVVQFVGGG